MPSPEVHDLGVLIMNPLLDFSGLPRFGEIQPDHVTPARRSAARREPRACWSGSQRRRKRPLGRLRRAARRRQRAAVARVGPGGASERGDEQPARCARSTTPTCPRSRSTTPSCRRTSGCTASSRRSAPQASFAAPRRRAEEDRRQRAARLPARRRRAAAGAEGALQGDARAARRAVVALQRQRARRDQRVLPSGDRRGRAGGHSAETCWRRPQRRPQADGKAGWKFTLHMPSYLPVMQYADNRPLRELMYRAYVTRASEFGKSEWDNTPLIAEILRLRRAGGAAARLRELRRAVARRRRWRTRRSRCSRFLTTSPRARSPLPSATSRSCRASRAQELGLDGAEGLGHGWASEKLRVERYAFSEQEVKQYFPEDRVLPGMFRLVETLYGIRIAPGQAPDLACRRALLRHPQCHRRADRPVLSRPVRATLEARRRVDGRRHHPQAPRQADADAGRLPHLQFLGAGRRQAGAVHAQRSDHAVPRVRPRPAPSAHAGRASRRVRHQRRGVGRGRAAQPVHGELLLGVGRARRA